MCEEIRKQWLEALIRIDRHKANQIIDDWIKNKGSDHVFRDILRPALEEIGDIWAVEKEITFAQVYVATTIAEDLIMKVAEYSSEEIISRPTKILLGNIENDYHSLGKRLVDITLRSSGWETIDLGVDVPAEVFVDEAIERDIKIIMISAMMYANAMGIKEVRKAINHRGYEDKMKIIVGGAVFNVKDNLWKEVGADAYGQSALDAGRIAQKMFDSLNSEL